MNGTLIDGRYRLGSVLGHGGMSIVYAAEDLELGRKVAIKLLQDGSNEVLGERLFREARAAAATRHPAVVTVYGHGVDSQTGIAYLVMERLDGIDLSRKLANEQRLAISLVFAVGLEVAEVLADVHTRGIIHRDLKPANIFLDRRGQRTDEVRLLDFGVAKQLGMATLTKPGQIVGTYGYMAPEQLVGGVIDARTDLYALGLVLYECLTGQPAFFGKSIPRLVQAALAQDVASPHELRADAPPALCEIIVQCIQREPAKRIDSAATLHQLLSALSGRT